ncbi:MAG: Asp23/Gls24 family envelope stress response protein [Rubrobacteraceae bacterium]
MGSTRAQSKQHPLQSDRGTTIVQEAAVKTIVGIAANEVDGAATSTGGTRLPGDTSRTVGEFLSGSEAQTRGVSVEAGELETAVDLTMVVEYGRPVAQVTQAVRENVIRRVESLSGLTVTEVNVNVVDVNFPDQT